MRRGARVAQPRILAPRPGRRDLELQRLQRAVPRGVLRRAAAEPRIAAAHRDVVAPQRGGVVAVLPHQVVAARVGGPVTARQLARVDSRVVDRRRHAAPRRASVGHQPLGEACVVGAARAQQRALLPGRDLRDHLRRLRRAEREAVGQRDGVGAAVDLHPKLARRPRRDPRAGGEPPPRADDETAHPPATGPSTYSALQILARAFEAFQDLSFSPLLSVCCRRQQGQARLPATAPKAASAGQRECLCLPVQDGGDVQPTALRCGRGARSTTRSHPPFLRYLRYRISRYRRHMQMPDDAIYVPNLVEPSM